MQWSGILFQSPFLNQNPELGPFKNSKVIKKKKKKIKKQMQILLEILYVSDTIQPTKLL